MTTEFRRLHEYEFRRPLHKHLGAVNPVAAVATAVTVTIWQQSRTIRVSRQVPVAVRTEKDAGNFQPSTSQLR